MPSWNSRGLRGSLLETLINMTNDKYREEGLAIVQKVPTPITPVRIDSETKQITLAYFDQKSTVDYIGAVQGIPVCFDAKECAAKSFPLANVHEHQIRFMADMEKQKGVAFFLIYFNLSDEYYYCPFKEMEKYWKRAEEGGRKSIKREEFTEGWLIGKRESVPVHYLEALNEDLLSRSE